MPPRRRNTHEIEMDEMRRRIQELETTVQTQQAMLESRSEYPEDDSDNNSSSSTDYRRRPQQQSFRLNDIKVDIPEFEGRLQPDEFVDWLQTVERVFEYKEIPDEQKVKIVAIKLKKHASIWWENLKKRREREGKSKIRMWDKMRRELSRKFLPENYYQDNFLQLHNLRQKAMSVEEYTREFEKLMMKCDIQEREEQTIARYIGGLNTNIAHPVQLQQYWTLDDVIRLAIRIEKQLPKRSPFQPSSSTEIPLDEHEAHLHQPTQMHQTNSSNKPPPKATKEFRSKAPKCFKCQGFGHIASECPTRRVVTIIEGETSAVFEEEEELIPNKEPVFDEEPIFDEEVIHPDHGETLVIRRSLHTAIEEEEPWLRRNIFHTRCTTQGKVCDVIIDNGSCENVVSNYMVEKLQLPTHNHPYPYKLQWFNKGSAVKVSKQCLVTFSIGKRYHDEVWCDVVPMDACHLLLGRPWQYDRRALYDGYANTYSFQKDDVKIQLEPLPPDKHIKIKNKSKSFLLKHKVSDLSPFIDDDVVFDSRTSPVQPRENETEKKTEHTCKQGEPAEKQGRIGNGGMTQAMSSLNSECRLGVGVHAGSDLWQYFKEF